MPVLSNISKWNVKTPMSIPINDKIVVDMTAAVEVANSIQPTRPHPMTPDGGSEYRLFSTITPDKVHMLSKEREFKYGQGKEIAAFCDGPKGISGKDMKYVKFFYIYDNKPGEVKPNPKTYTFSIPKARDFWNDKVNEGYVKLASVEVEPENPEQG